MSGVSLNTMKMWFATDKIGREKKKCYLYLTITSFIHR